MSTKADEPKPPDWVPAQTPPPVGAPGWAEFFDLFVMHSSAGADSQEMMRRAAEVFHTAGVMDKVAGLHIVLDRRDLLDLDADDRTRIEWPQVPQLAAEQARRCGLALADGDGWAVWDARAAGTMVERSVWASRVHYARRINRDGSDWDGDLLDDIASRRKQTEEDKRLRRRATGELRGWPTMWTRYCTSDWKTAVGRAFTEYLCRQIRAEQGLIRPVRVLQVMGFRAEESDDRAARQPYALNYGVSAETLRHVWEWLPIHTLTLVDRWDAIRESGIPYHPVYDEGMSRLSCRRCILASRKDLEKAAEIDPAGHAAYVAVEADLNDPFQANVSRRGGVRVVRPKPLADITAGDPAQAFAVRWDTCPTCGVPTLANAAKPTRACPAHAEHGPWDNPTAPAGTGCAATEAGGWPDLLDLLATTL